MPDDSVATQPSDPSTTTVQPVDSTPYTPADSTGGTAYNILANQQAQQTPAGPPPANATAPLNMPTAAPYMSTPTPPDVKEHLNWIQRTLGAVGTALAGPTSWKVTKLPDGTVTSEPIKDTTGKNGARLPPPH